MTDIQPPSSTPIVLKIGGARAVDPQGALADVAALRAAEQPVIVVHGGSTTVDETLEELGETPTYVETPNGVVGRFTDARTMEVFEMVLPGRLNTELVVELQNAGVDAIGLSGVDGGLLSGPRKSAVRIVEDGKRKIKRGDHSGRIESVNTELLSTLLEAGYTPVVTVPMLGEDEHTHLAVNADADRAAAAVAGAVGGQLVVLTDVPGVLSDPDDESTVIDTVTTPDAMDDLKAAAEGFMQRKVMAATEALEHGATKVLIADANMTEPVQTALEGAGTHITADALDTSHDDTA